MALTIVGMGLITYGIRLSMFLLADRFPLPPGLLRALRYVPAAVLSAIIVPDVLMVDGTVDLSLTNPRLLAAIVGAVVAWRTRNVFLTVVAGMVVYWLMSYWLVR
jgi:branched-subunit amino acid transport protein